MEQKKTGRNSGFLSDTDYAIMWILVNEFMLYGIVRKFYIAFYI